MTLDYLHITLICLTVCAVLYAAVCRLRVKNAKDKAAKRAENRLKEELRIYKDALEREKYLYENLKTEKKPSEEHTFSEDRTALIESSALVLGQKKLEQEQKEFAEKNRRLWEMSLSIQREKEHIAILKSDIEKKHRSVTDSIRYARRIQLAVLPPKDVLKESFADYFLFWRPREIVSGDFYWMKKSGDIVAFTVADCTGHGVPGSFMSLLGITFLNDICANLDENTLPSDILEKLRECITGALSQDISANEPQDGMDMAFCILNLKTKKLRFSGGNNPLYLIRDGVLTEFKSVKNPIGYYPRPKKFETIETDLQSGDWLYMFSDGLADQFGGKDNRKLTYKRFREFLTENAVFSGETQSEKLGAFMDSWQNGRPQMDDMMTGGYKIL